MHLSPLASVRLTILLVASLGSPLAAQQPSSFAETPKTKKADEALAAGIDDATQSYLKGREKEFAAWLRAYERALASAKAAGDPDAVEYLTKAIAQSKQAGFVVKPPPPDALKFEGHSYALIEEAAGWHVAKRRCELMGGHLVTIESPGEADFVVTSFGEKGFWIGAGDFKNEGEHVWLNGERFDPHGYAARFNNRDDAQHGLGWNPADQYWDDGDEGFPSAYLCEWDR